MIIYIFDRFTVRFLELRSLELLIRQTLTGFVIHVQLKVTINTTDSSRLNWSRVAQYREYSGIVSRNVRIFLKHPYLGTLPTSSCGKCGEIHNDAGYRLIQRTCRRSDFRVLYSKCRRRRIRQQNAGEDLRVLQTWRRRRFTSFANKYPRCC